MEGLSSSQVDSKSIEQNNNKSNHVTRKRLIKKRSFMDALKEKYCVNMNDSNYEFVHIVITGKPRSSESDAELGHLRNIVLDEHQISYAGIPRGGLVGLCPNVVDLDLAHNNINCWSELLDILCNLPTLKFANLSGNKVAKDEDILKGWPEKLPSIENLVLNRTGISWSELEVIAEHFPSLKELHVCGNDFESLDCKWSLFTNLECLRLNNNKITSWSEVWKLRHIKNLKNLILSGNPLHNVNYGPCCQGSQAEGHSGMKSNLSADPEQHLREAYETASANVCNQILDELLEKAWKRFGSTGEEMDDVFTAQCQISENSNDDSDVTPDTSMNEENDSQSLETELCPLCQSQSNFKPFPKLHTLCLTETQIADWQHLQALSDFPKLSAVRITGIPLISNMPQDDRWMLYIASLPKVCLLNGSEVSNTEREKSERFFLRHFLSMAESERPERYVELEKKHGKLTQIVDIDLSARYEEWPTLDFVLHRHLEFQEKVHVVGAVGKLRTFVANKLGIPRSMFRLFHQSKVMTSWGEIPEMEELFLDSLPLSRYDIMTGDEIHIDIMNI